LGRSNADRQELAVLVMAIAARAHAVKRILVSAEDPAALAPFAEAGAATALIMPGPRARELIWAPRPPPLVRLAIHTVGVSVMRHWHARATAVEVWPANTRSQLALARSLGVDGVLTNDPAGARDAFDGLQLPSYASGG